MMSYRFGVSRRKLAHEGDLLLDSIDRRDFRVARPLL
jgi:hypothetical protein